MVEYIVAIAGESDNLTFGSGELTVDTETEKALIESYESRENAIMLLAFEGEELVGMLNFDGGARTRTKHAGEFGITVRESHWGLGIGRMMITTLIDWAKETGTIRKIDLRVRSDNERAIRLYENLGFLKEGVLSRSMLINGVFIDFLLMGKAID